MSKKILVTGAAGFIGFHLSRDLLGSGHEVIGFDNLNSYYDISLKQARLDKLNKFSLENNYSWKFFKGNLENKLELFKLFEKYEPSIIVHLAAQAGVRYSLINPEAYIQSNILGFQNILDCSKEFNIRNLIYASSSSVYGGNTKTPFSEEDEVNHPVSLYAASKKANELFAHAYSHIYGIPSTALRFFTVYGPWGRPDMATMIFAKAILEKKPIRIFNNGDMQRDFTYIDDVIKAISRLIKKPATANPDFQKESPDSSTSWSPHRIFNIGNSKPISLMHFIETLESELGEKAIKTFEPMQLGDVKATYADTTKLNKWVGYQPNTSINEGIKEFVDWFKYFYKSN